MMEMDKILERVEVLKTARTVQLLAQYKELFGDKTAIDQLGTSGQFRDESWILRRIWR